jgi:hypothetical protein
MILVSIATLTIVTTIETVRQSVKVESTITAFHGGLMYEISQEDLWAFRKRRNVYIVFDQTGSKMPGRVFSHILSGRLVAGVKFASGEMYYFDDRHNVYQVSRSGQITAMQSEEAFDALPAFEKSEPVEYSLESFARFVNNSGFRGTAPPKIVVLTDWAADLQYIETISECSMTEVRRRSPAEADSQVAGQVFYHLLKQVADGMSAEDRQGASGDLAALRIA